MGIVEPSDKMPAPGQYFFLVNDSGERIPAIVRCHCDPKEFYQFCKVFSKDGEVWSTTRRQLWRGWMPMFQETKTYKIEYL